MAWRRGTGRTSVSRTFKPATDWASARLGGSLVADGEVDVFNLSTSAIEDLDNDPETVRRIRGGYSLLVPNGSTDVGYSNFGLGIGVAPREAVNNGFVPFPLTDLHWDGWLYIVDVPGIVGPGSSSFTAFRSVSDQGIDSRAMRRLEDNDLFLAVEIDSISGPGISYEVYLRWLLSDSSRR